MSNLRCTGIGLAAAALGLVAVANPAGAQNTPTTDPGPPTTAPPGTAAPDQVVAVTSDAAGLPVAAVFGWHSAQRGVGVNHPRFINGSGGNGYRQMSIGFDQNT